MLVTLKEILAPARENHFAVPAFNTSSNMILTGVMDASREAKAPVIIAIHPDELSFVRESFVKAVIDEADKSEIPVCIHLDHGASFKQVMHAIKCGYTSVMIDASLSAYEDNVELTKKVVEASHYAGVSVEAELGTIGGTEADGIASTEGIIYTRPEDASDFVLRTGIDALAVAIGTAHGLYPKDKKPELRLDILDEIASAVDIPLVLHGGSDNPDDEIREAVKRGISKVNISSDIKSAFYKKAREVLEDKSLREPNQIYPACIEAMKSVVKGKIDLFGARGALKYYR